MPLQDKSLRSEPEVSQSRTPRWAEKARSLLESTPRLRPKSMKNKQNFQQTGWQGVSRKRGAWVRAGRWGVCSTRWQVGNFSALRHTICCPKPREGLCPFIHLWLLFFKILLFFAVLGLCCCARAWGYSSSWCAGFSLQWLLLLRSTGSRRTGFSSCGTWAQ